MSGRKLLIIVVASVSLLTGCQGTGQIMPGGSTVGTLKTAVSQLEFQNDQLKKEVAGLKSENRKFENRLVQEQAENDDLATRLDNVKSMLGQRGEPEDIRTGSARSKPSKNDVDDDLPPPRRRSSTRKPPAASIPGRIEPSSPDDDLGQVDGSSSRNRLASSKKPRAERWLPVANGIGTKQTEIR